MPSFAYYSKSDPSKEVVMKATANSAEAAYDYFSRCKSLDLKEFKKLFEVVRDDRS